MRTWSILKTHVIVEFDMLILVTVSNFTFIWICWTLVWQYITFVTFLWIIDADMVNIENTCYSWVHIVNDQISPLSVCFTLVWQRVTFLWIINEAMVNIENTCHSWVRHADISHCQIVPNFTFIWIWKHMLTLVWQRLFYTVWHFCE